MFNTINQFAKILTENDTNLRIALHEKDKFPEVEPEAAHFLKLNEQRLGRDLELYNFMAQISGEAWTIATILQEIVLPLQKTAPLAFKAGIEFLRTDTEVLAFFKEEDHWGLLLDAVLLISGSHEVSK